MSKITTIIARCCDGTCTVAELESLYEHDREVTFGTFFRHVSLKAVSQILGYQYRTGQRLHIRNDYAIRFYRSKFRGKPCWHIDWSAIDHIFQNP